jgi:virulence-associated protein VapD
METRPAKTAANRQRTIARDIAEELERLDFDWAGSVYFAEKSFARIESCVATKQSLFHQIPSIFDVNGAI